MQIRQTIKCAALAAVGLLSLSGMAARAQDLNGAGATFPAPLYQKWFQEYAGQHGTRINYQPVGSGAGITRITDHTVDFGASDAPMNSAEMQRAPGILHIPTVAGAVVIAYNVPGFGPGVHLSGPVIADIFLGKITKWNDPAIRRLNPAIRSFPDLAITPFHRADGSGTTNIFTTYLSEVSGDWRDRVGAGKSVSWPNGSGGSGNPGVARLVKRTTGGVGYIELAYAVNNQLEYAAVRNAHGTMIYPDVNSTTVAVDAVPLPADFRKVAVNTSAPGGYPITGFTFLLVYKNGTKPAVKQFLQWALTTGQNSASSLLYAPLPNGVRRRALAAVASMR